MFPLFESPSSSVNYLAPARFRNFGSLCYRKLRDLLDGLVDGVGDCLSDVIQVRLRQPAHVYSTHSQHVNVVLGAQVVNLTRCNTSFPTMFSKNFQKYFKNNFQKTLLSKKFQKQFQETFLSISKKVLTVQSGVREHSDLVGDMGPVAGAL
jgi:hypothetical protein